MKKQNLIKTLIRGVLFVTLLIIFYVMYMKSAIEQFTKASTTVSQTTKELTEKTELEPPIFLFCVDPPFKPSFFKNHSVTNLGIEKYFWLFPHTWKRFENHSAPELYLEMSRHLGLDWKMMMVALDYQKWVLHKFFKLMPNLSACNTKQIELTFKIF